MAEPALSKKQQIELALAADPTATHTEIARRSGVTRQYVNQVANSIGATAAARRALRRKDIEAERLLRKRVKRSALAHVRKYIAPMGLWICGSSQHEGPALVLLDEQMPTGRCKTCNRRLVRNLRATPEGRAKLAAWQAANPEKLKEYMRRYLAKRRDGAVAQARAQ